MAEKEVKETKTVKKAETTKKAAAPKTETKTVKKAATETATETKPAAKTTTKKVAEKETKPATKTAAKTAEKAETKTVKKVVKTETKIEAKAEKPATKTAAKTAEKAETKTVKKVVKAETKIEAKAEKPATKKPATKTAKPKKTAGKAQEFLGTGKRKTSVARVRLTTGTGKITVNGEELKKYFELDTLVTLVKQPLVLTETENTVDVVANIYGGGKSGQAGALRHGITRALIEYKAELRPELKKAGFVTRDARKKERKKYGLHKARRAPQFSKR